MPTQPEVCARFGHQVRQFRLVLGLSQEALADQAKIHRTYIGGIERGERNPTLTMIVRLARALNIPSATLMADLEPSEADDESR